MKNKNTPAKDKVAIDENQQDKISKSAWVTIIIVSSTLLVMMLGETMLIPAIPDIMTEFGVGYNQSAWIFSSFLIVGAVMIPVAGKLSDIYNKKKVLLDSVTKLVYETRNLKNCVRSPGGNRTGLFAWRSVHPVPHTPKDAACNPPGRRAWLQGTQPRNDGMEGVASTTSNEKSST